METDRNIVGKFFPGSRPKPSLRPLRHNVRSKKRPKTFPDATDSDGNISSSQHDDMQLDTARISLERIRSPLITDRRKKSKKAMKENTLKQPAMMTSMREGIQRAYLDGLEFIRTKISEMEQEVGQVRTSFYDCKDGEEESEEKREEYLKRCNENFLIANNELRRKNVKLNVIDSEMKVVGVINKLREVADVDQGEIAFITQFWENVKQTVEGLRMIVEKFQTNVLQRLNQSCTSYNNADINLEVSDRYMEEIISYIAGLEREITNIRLLLKSFDSGIHQDLYTDSKFSDKLMVSCDLKAFPILRLVPDLTAKVERLCDISRKWLDRDQQYMDEVNNYIKKTRNMTKRREEVLKNQKEKQKKIEKAVKTAHILLHNNREKLQKIEMELDNLEVQLSGFKTEKKTKHSEKSQKSSMADFLKITLTQTKKNYNLQMKRQRLVKQVHDLEEFLVSIERELSDVEDQMMVKKQEKFLLREKVDTHQKTYEAFKTDFDRYSDGLEKLEQEVNVLSGQLLQLEIIQTYKSSPENVEQIFDRPQTVKLAPSLKEKIRRKRKALVTSE
ncbi:polyamine-modulated factor 1-binding protein 1-like isoform X2 [Mizuhopecten yessoensis]|uniref:polyamine-modulated factor 1-binding protein 1-like isoform X2 n=1 Tax=Mizuhopecten yessoensis TaxID=6573 RepID=UPI000B457EDD|nr:polyamine-modulated factor 1-binding protein 1-like isoform X2 [Mizuhopecten yessoensis]